MRIVKTRSVKTRFLLTLLAAIAAGPASAHVGDNAVHSLASGLMHPVTGIDHVAAMLAVGFWSAQAGGRRLGVWPAAFVAAMLVGAALAAVGVQLPLVEPVILASIVVLGLLTTLALDVPAAAGALLIAVFAMAHGHAHGAEAAGADFATYAAGLAGATGLLHLAGIGLALVARHFGGAGLPRAMGAATTALGVLLFVG